MELISQQAGESLLDLGKRCNAVYVCPKKDGIRTGPLVVYAGKDDKGRNLIGDIYFNFAMIEPHLEVVAAFAEKVRRKIVDAELLDTFDTICGIPSGGQTFGQELARITGKRFVYPQRSPKPVEVGRKQEYDWDVSRFTFKSGERVAIAEDVFNNFQNTDSTLTQITTDGAKIELLVGALNRSPEYELEYVPKSGPCAGKSLPIIASIREAYPEYQQDDPRVIADVTAGNVEFEVKKNWGRLTASV